MPAEKRTAPREKRVVAAPMLSLALDDEIERLKKEPEWLSGDRNSATLVKTSHLSVVLVLLRKGATMCGHEVEGPITVFALSGSIRFGAGQDTRVLKSRDLLSLDKEIPHDVEALEDSAFLLTVLRPVVLTTGSNPISRVEYPKQKYPSR